MMDGIWHSLRTALKPRLGLWTQRDSVQSTYCSLPTVQETYLSGITPYILAMMSDSVSVAILLGNPGRSK